MTSARIKYIFLGWVGDSLGKRRHQRGQEETFEPPYLEKEASQGAGGNL